MSLVEGGEKRESFGKKVGSVTLVKIVGAGVAVCTNILLARLLEPSELSAYVGVMAVLAILTRGSVFGLGQAAQYFGARESLEKKCYKTIIFRYLLFLNVVVTVTLPLWKKELQELLFLDEPLAGAILEVVIITVPLGAVAFVTSLYILGRKEIMWYGINAVFPVIGATAILVWGYLSDQGVIVVVTAVVIQQLISFLLSLVWLIFICKRSEWEGSGGGNILEYGLRSFGISIGAFIAGRIPLIVGPWFVGSYEMGLFAVARIFADCLLLAYGPVGVMVFSFVGGSDEIEKIRLFVEKACRIGVITFSCISVVLAVLAPWGVYLLFGTDYAASYVAVWFLLPGLTFSAIQKTVENYLFGRNRQGLMIINPLISSGVFLATISGLGERYGAGGLALAASCGYITSTAYTLIVASKVDGLNAYNALVPRGEDIVYLIGVLRRICASGRVRFSTI